MSSFFRKNKDILDVPLLAFSPKDELTVRDVLQGNFIVGGVGSGKTSGSGRSLAHALLKNNFGGLVLTAKRSEKDLWIRYCKETGREDSLLIVSPEIKDNPMTFNFLNWESKRPGRGGGNALNIRQFLMDILDALRSKSSGGSNEQFWTEQTKKLLDVSIDLLQLAQSPITIENIVQVIKSAPDSLAQLQNQDTKNKSYCMQLMARAHNFIQSIKSSDDKYRSERDQNRFRLIYEYWCDEFPKTASDKQKASLIMIITGMLQDLRQDPLVSLFCGKTTFLPEYSRKGAIILMDLSVEEYKETGRVGQIIMKLAWQRAMLSSAGGNMTDRPVFCWADEAQNFISKTDHMFTSLSREYRATTVYMTQNLPGLFSSIGNGEEGKKQIFSLLGNLQNKFFHSNDDPETNEYASSIFGKGKVSVKTTTDGISTTEGVGKGMQNTRDGDFNAGGAHNTEHTSKNSTNSVGHSETIEYLIQSSEFIKLRRHFWEGGNSFSEAIVFLNGRTWSSGNNFMKCLFKQGS